MPESFEFPKRGPLFNGTPAQAWIPIAFSDVEKETTRGMMFNNSVVARLKPGISLEQAQNELGLLARRIRENYPPMLRIACSSRCPRRRCATRSPGRSRRFCCSLRPLPWSCSSFAPMLRT